MKHTHSKVCIQKKNNRKQGRKAGYPLVEQSNRRGQTNFSRERVQKLWCCRQPRKPTCLISKGFEGQHWLLELCLQIN